MIGLAIMLYELLYHAIQISLIIIQHIVTVSKYGHSALKFVERAQQISCDIRNFVCRGEKWWFFQHFFSINVENCALSSMC